jgi:hypothetical protein
LLVLLAVGFTVFGAASCGASGGQACSTDGDCEPGFECVSSGGVVFGDSLCLLDDQPVGDAGLDVADASTDASASDADSGPGADADADSGACDAANCPLDFDDDGVPDDQDNCPLIANADQANLDGDLSGDACDSDIDGDGIANSEDNCPQLALPVQDDLDGDSLGNGCDDDDDGDGVADVDDNCPLNANPEQADFDGDGDGDACDSDLDADGHANADDNCPERINPQQADRDHDDIGDACDPSIEGDLADAIYAPSQVLAAQQVARQVASGDVTGDGVDDLLITAPSGIFGNRATAYVVDGASPGGGSVNLGQALAVIETESFDDDLGLRIAFGGDVNGDGIGDLLIGNPGENGGDGAAYIFYGGASLSGERSMSSADVRVFGDSNLEAGYSIAGIGDVNDDGIDDVGFGQPRGRNGDGAVLVLFGSASLPSQTDIGFSDMQLAGANNDRAGTAIAGVGDVNADGVDDFLVGAPEANSKSGAAILVYGYASGATLPATNTALRDEGVELTLGTNAFRNEGLLGSAVAGVGDLDGDGNPDLAIGAPESEWSTFSRAGAAFVVFGDGATMPARGGAIDLSAEALSFVLTQDNARVGESLAGGGDIDGDGHPDLLIGAPRADRPSGNRNAGAVYLVSNFAGLTGSVGSQIDLAGAPVSFLGAARDDAFGASVCVVDDLGTDGRSEVLISAPLHDVGGRNDSGAAFLFSGL